MGQSRPIRQLGPGDTLVPSSGSAGINSAGETWHSVGTSDPIYHNRLDNNYAGVVDDAVKDARGKEAFVSGEDVL